MKAMAACPKCGSSQIIRGARMVDHEEGYELDLQVEVYEHPEAKIDVDRHARHGVARLNVCGACGYAELFVEGHEKLWAAYRQSRSRTADARSEPVSPAR
jgi:predicted nucleic-acid-binding Zn-ribbon protein